jgi:hypothetical protein
MYVLEMLVPEFGADKFSSVLDWGVAQEWKVTYLHSQDITVLNSSMPGRGVFVFVCDFEKVLHSFACISRN